MKYYVELIELHKETLRVATGVAYGIPLLLFMIHVLIRGVQPSGNELFKETLLLQQFLPISPMIVAFSMMIVAYATLFLLDKSIVAFG